MKVSPCHQQPDLTMCKQRAIKSAGPENRDPLLILDDFITRDGVPNGAPSPSLR
jgi:hypothetical protein